MAADLECFDENGYATLTAGTLFGRVLGTFSTGTSNGSRYFPGLTTGGAEPWSMSMPQNNVLVACLPVYTIANDTISWTFTDFAGPNGQLAQRFSATCIVGTD